MPQYHVSSQKNGDVQPWRALRCRRIYNDDDDHKTKAMRPTLAPNGEPVTRGREREKQEKTKCRKRRWKRDEERKQ